MINPIITPTLIKMFLSRLYMGSKVMKKSIFRCPKYKLLLLLIISFLWSLLIFSVLISSLTISTFWLRDRIQLYYYTSVAFLLVAIAKGQGKLNKVNELKIYAKIALNAFVITINVAHAVFCGWVVYMVLKQSIPLAAAAGSLQILFNTTLLFVKDIHGCRFQ